MTIREAEAQFIKRIFETECAHCPIRTFCEEHTYWNCTTTALKFYIYSGGGINEKKRQKYINV